MLISTHISYLTTPSHSPTIRSQLLLLRRESRPPMYGASAFARCMRTSQFRRGAGRLSSDILGDMRPERDRHGTSLNAIEDNFKSSLHGLLLMTGPILSYSSSSSSSSSTAALFAPIVCVSHPTFLHQTNWLRLTLIPQSYSSFNTLSSPSTNPIPRHFPTCILPCILLPR